MCRDTGSKLRPFFGPEFSTANQQTFDGHNTLYFAPAVTRRCTHERVTWQARCTKCPHEVAHVSDALKCRLVVLF